MKKRFYLITILILTVGACSSSKKSSNQVAETAVEVEELSSSSNTNGLQKITGDLNYSGSEPFITPTIFISGESSYKLIGDENFIQEVYPSINGEKASLYGKVIEKGNLVYFEVHFYEIIKD